MKQQQLKRTLMAVLVSGMFLPLGVQAAEADLLKKLEALTLVQTGKIAPIPIILVGSAYWAGLADWVKTRMVDEGMISPGDVDLMHIIDKPEEVVEAIFSHYEKRGFMPSLAEREIQLNL